MTRDEVEQRARTERHCPHCGTALWAVRDATGRGYRGGWAWFPRGFAGDALCARCARGLAADQTVEGAR